MADFPLKLFMRQCLDFNCLNTESYFYSMCASGCTLFRELIKIPWGYI